MTLHLSADSSNMAGVADELEAVEAIYCQPGEISISRGGDGSKQVKVRIKSAAAAATEKREMAPVPVEVDLCFLLPSAYPSKAPDVSVQSDQLSRSETAHLRTVLCEAAAQNLEQPMLMQLISLASEELCVITASKPTKASPTDSENDGNSTSPPDWTDSSRTSSDDRLVLLHLDHMRAKTQYIKLIKKWVAELSLSGCLVFCQRLILILLQGPMPSIKEYIIRQRTSNVDVDSKGHPCKERMLSVLCDMAMADHIVRLEGFREVEMSSADDLKQFFTKCGLSDIFLSHIRSLKNFPGK